MHVLLSITLFRYKLGTTNASFSISISLRFSIITDLLFYIDSVRNTNANLTTQLSIIFGNILLHLQTLRRNTSYLGTQLQNTLVIKE